MTLDNKQQRELLIQLIQSAGIGGNKEQAKQTITVLDKLEQSVREAEIKTKLVNMKPIEKKEEPEKDKKR